MDTNTAMAKMRVAAFAVMTMAAAAVSAAAPGEPVAPAQNPATCGTCGVVESVTVVQRQGQTKGIAGTQVTPGMAIGGVVGGLLGNQFGHGGGRAATTVIGAAGGAYAGHAIEKNQARYTAYVMNIRMEDGTMRTIEQRTALAKGAHVVLHGKTARFASTSTAHG
jgi:outer membrane lipoprotein SlyB